MSVDLTSLVECRNLYIDYYYKGNKADTKKCEIKQLESQYKDYLSQWREVGQGVENDTNEYVIDDDDWNLAASEGESKAEDKTGYKASGAKNVGNSIVTGTNLVLTGAGKAASLGAGQGLQILGNTTANVGASVGNAGLGTVAGGLAKMSETLSKKATEKVAEKAATEATKKATEEAATKGNKAFGNGAWVVAIPIELASAIMALATNQNGNEADALTELTTLLGDAQSDISDAQMEMEDAAMTVAEKEQEVIDINDTSSQEMIALQTKSNSYYSTYTYLEQKQSRGEELSAGEISLMKTMKTKVDQNNAAQTTMQAETEETRATAVDELGTYTETFDYAAEAMANTQGMTDYGASFDKCTKVLCIVAMASDALNVISAGKDALKAGAFAASGTWAFGATAWAWAWVAMAAAAAVMSGIDGVRQYQHLQAANQEIEVRETTEQLNEGVAGTYDTDITEYDASMQSLGELEVLDLEKKTISDSAVAVATSQQTTNTQTNTQTNTEDNTKKKVV